MLGGNGYLGANICEAAHIAGLHVTVVCRTGKPHPKDAESFWSNSVDYVSGDISERGPWVSTLEGCTGLISCVGAFGSPEQMLRINGHANAHAAAVAKE